MDNGYCEKHERPYQFFCICGDWRYECPQCRSEGVYDMVATTQTKMNPANEWTASDKAEAEAWVMIPKLDEKGTGCVLDMRPLVLCKDCKRRGTYDCPVYVGGDGMYSEPDDWFCADGEMK